MILRNFKMASSLSCLRTHVHRVQVSFLSYSKTLSSQVVINLDMAGHILKPHIFSALNVTWRSLKKIQSTYLCPAFIIFYHTFQGYLWNMFSLVSSALTHMTFHISAIMRMQDMMRTRTVTAWTLLLLSHHSADEY